MLNIREKFPFLPPQKLLLLGFAGLLILNFPGQISYDTVVQLADARSGHYSSWHPPVMAWLLSLSDTILRGTGILGTGIFLLFVVSLLLASWLLLLRSGRAGRPAAIALVVIMATPQFLIYQGEIWKDILFANAAVAGFCFLAAAGARWQTSRVRFLLLAFSALLFALATLARQNGVVTVPVAALSIGIIAYRRHSSWWRYGFGLMAAVMILVLAGNLALGLRSDHGKGNARQFYKALTFDLTGVLRLDPSIRLTILEQKAPDLEAAIRKDGIRLYAPHLMDTLEGSQFLIDSIYRAPPGVVFAQWRQVVLEHPGTYLRHRLPVFRWVVAPPELMTCHPAVVGVSGPADVLESLGMTHYTRRQDVLLFRWASLFFHTPVYSHLFYAALSLLSMGMLARRAAPADMAVAGLQVAALLFALSFFFLSVACDYRYLYFLDLAALTGVLQYFCRPQSEGLRAAG